jgi:hypothetical protein
MITTRRGRSSALAKSAIDSVPVSGPSSPNSAMKASVRLVVRLCTATGTPWWAMLRARLAPMVARPVSPIWLAMAAACQIPATVVLLSPPE